MNIKMAIFFLLMGVQAWADQPKPEMTTRFDLLGPKPTEVSFLAQTRIVVNKDESGQTVYVLIKEHKDEVPGVPLQVMKFKIAKDFGYSMNELGNFRKADAAFPILVPERQRLGLWRDGRIALCDDRGNFIDWLVEKPKSVESAKQARAEPAKVNKDSEGRIKKAIKRVIIEMGNHPGPRL